MAERCTVRLASNEQCPQTDTVQVEAGCVHEHVTTGWMCPADLAKSQRSDMFCTPCYDGEDSHECRIQLLETADG